MKLFRMLGILAAILGMSGLLGLAGSVLSGSDATATPKDEISTTSGQQQSQSSILIAAVTTAQESTSLTQ